MISCVSGPRVRVRWVGGRPPLPVRVRPPHHGLAMAAWLPTYKQPAHLVVVDELPRTTAGKVSKRDPRRVVSQVADSTS